MLNFLTSQGTPRQPLNRHRSRKYEPEKTLEEIRAHMNELRSRAVINDNQSKPESFLSHDFWDNAIRRQPANPANNRDQGSPDEPFEIWDEVTDLAEPHTLKDVAKILGAFMHRNDAQIEHRMAELQDDDVVSSDSGVPEFRYRKSHTR